jgi:glycerophosphoryl diester phosphodiesterase
MRFLMYRWSYIALLACCSVAALSSCGTGSQEQTETPKAVQGGTPTYDLAADGRTDKPAQVRALPGSGYDVEALLTVGDEIPLLIGNYPGGNGHPKRTYGLPGIPDGLGVSQHGKNYFVWMNHEIAPGNFSNYSATVGGQINGARVSILKFDENWRVVGGRNLVERIYEGGVLIGTALLNNDKTAVTQTGSVLNRLCSATLTELYSNKPLFLTGEESSNGRPFAVDFEGNARVIGDLPLFAYENIVPVSKWSDKTVMVALDDTFDRFLVSYVGNRTAADPCGLYSGTSYVGRVTVGGVFQANSALLPLGTDVQVEWVEIPRFDGVADLYNNTNNFYAWAGSRATRFARPEDGHEDVNISGDVHWVTTGRLGTYDQYGSVWKLVYGATPTAAATLRLTSTGSPTSYMNPDNVVADSFGSFWIQEDPSGTQGLMLAAGRRASIYRGPLGGNSYVRLFEVLQDTAPFIPPVTAPFASNPWETSGIVEVPGSTGQATVLFDTQAHGMPAPGYVEGGQLLLGIPQ